MATSKREQERLDRLRRLRSTRPIVQDYLIGFLKNFRNAQVVHGLLCKQGNPSFVHETAHQQYVVFLVRALEAYFRNVFVFACEASNDFRRQHLDRYSEKTSGLALLELVERKIDIVDLLADQFNFQNLNAVADAFGPLFEGDLLGHLGATVFSIYEDNHGERSSIKLDYSVPEWRKHLFGLFEYRHEIVHNGNCNIEVHARMFVASRLLR